ncbi:peroxisome biogenesis factor 2 isoform X2 [Equus quagga]|uniref:peroxisome biogenesis factor 2 isoform X2 n=1 Tax=Equus quagga TaxID=89248 RepID=UPI001EE39984|nr:peroxisome biogenesis factor 2 isoform X2 [Equus quagga]
MHPARRAGPLCRAGGRLDGASGAPEPEEVAATHPRPPAQRPRARGRPPQGSPPRSTGRPAAGPRPGPARRPEARRRPAATRRRWSGGPGRRPKAGKALPQKSPASPRLLTPRPLHAPRATRRTGSRLSCQSDTAVPQRPADQSPRAGSSSAPRLFGSSAPRLLGSSALRPFGSSAFAVAAPARAFRRALKRSSRGFNSSSSF